MRLIFKGKILKDELTVEDFKITDGLTIHLVKGKTANAAATGGAEVPATSSDAASTASATTAANPGAAAGGLGAGGAGANPFAGLGGMGGMGGMGGGMPQMNPE